LLTSHSEGKIKHIGLSNVSASDVRRAAKITTISALQVEYSPFVLEIEGQSGDNLLAVARELGIAIVCYAPMGRGMVTSVFAANDAEVDPADMRVKALPRFMEENKDKNVQLVRQLQALAEKKHCNVSQLAIAWLMKQGDDIIPIPGTKRLKYLEDNWASLNVHLSDEDEKEVRAFVEKAEIAGDTMPPGLENAKFRETAKEL
jgi:aryl-alcohol dehydrogenase-like predicted oxidoreductase